jgi:hypothetical protein
MEPPELKRPDIDELLRPKRFRVLPVLVILGLCVFGFWLMSLGPSKPIPRNLPPFKIIPPRQPAPSARKAAAPPPFTVTLMPPQGWCCAGGKLSEVNRRTCEEDTRGTFFQTEEEARKGCGPTARSGSPRGPGRGI